MSSRGYGYGHGGGGGGGGRRRRNADSRDPPPRDGGRGYSDDEDAPRGGGGGYRGGGGGRRRTSAPAAARSRSPAQRGDSRAPPERPAARSPRGGGRAGRGGGRRARQAELDEDYSDEGESPEPRRDGDRRAPAGGAPAAGGERKAAAPRDEPARSGGSKKAPEKSAPVADDKSAAAAKKAQAVPLSVSNCKDQTISEIIAGKYVPVSTNHGRIVYKKQRPGSIDVMIYYWDDRDGPELCGWWFGPNVGGDQVWAYHPSRSASTPPASEWNVPHDGQIDPTFSVSVCKSSETAAAKAPAKRAEPREAAEEPPPKDRRGEGGGRRAAASPAAGASPTGSRREKSKAGADGKKPDVHEHFLNAYNKRFEERAKAEEARKREEEEKKQREEEQRRKETERRKREEDERHQELQRKMEQMKREEEEERRQMEDLKRRAEERRRREEELAAKERAAKEAAKGNEERSSRRGEREEDRREDRDRRGGGRDERGGRRGGGDRSRERGERERSRERRGGGGGGDRGGGDRGGGGGGGGGRREERPASRERAESRREEPRADEDRDRRRVEEPKRSREDDEERKKREEERRAEREKERRAKEEEMRRREDELQRRRDEKRRREDEERRKVDDERRRQREEDDRRRRDDQDRRRREDQERSQHMSAQKQKEEMSRKAEEEKRKEDEANALKQQKATLSVLRTLQKMSNATPENFDDVNTEFENMLTTDLPNTGPQQETLKAESKRVRDYAKQYVEQLREQQRKAQEAKEQEERRKEESEKTARSLLEQLDKLISVAEEAAEKARSNAEPLQEGHELNDTEVVRIALAVERAGKTAMMECSSCADFLLQKRPIMEQAEHIQEEVMSSLTLLQPRVKVAAQMAGEALHRSSLEKDKVAQKVVPGMREKRLKAELARIDKDGDGYISRAEIISYAKDDFGFEIPEESLGRICRQMIKPGNPGVKYEAFQLLKRAIGIAREEARCRVLRKIRLEKERREAEEAQRRRELVDAKHEEWKEPIAEMSKTLEDIGPKLTEYEESAQKLSNEAGELTTSQLRQGANALTELCAPSRAALDDISKRLDEMLKLMVELPELADRMMQDATSLRSKKDMHDARLRAVEGVAANGRQLAMHKAFAEKESVRMEVAAKLRVCIEAQGGSPENLFEAIKPDGLMDVEDIKSYLSKHNCVVETEKLEAIFPPPPPEEGQDKSAEGKAEENVGAPKARRLINKEEFMRAIRIFYKVVREIVLSNNLLIEQSKQIRKMDVGEVIEVHQGPMLDPSVGVYRVHGKALRDGIVGWVTVAGNQGVTFLLPGGHVYQVVRPCPLTEELKDTDGANTIRMLQEQQVLEVLEWSRTSRSALGVTRIRARIQGEDAAVGWATIADHDGNAYLAAA